MRKYFAIFALVGMGSLSFAAFTFPDDLCSSQKAMPNFDITKFLGSWFVIWESRAASSCARHVYTKMNNSELLYQLEEFNYYPKFIESDIHNVDSDEYKLQRLEVISEDNYAWMSKQQSWKLDPDHLVILSTDYENYALVYLCNLKPMEYYGVIRVAYIYSRKKSFDHKLRGQLEEELKNFKLPEISAFLRVIQKHCSPENEIVLN